MKAMTPKRHRPSRVASKTLVGMALACALTLASGGQAATAVEPVVRPPLAAIETGSGMPVYAQRTVTLQPSAVKSISRAKYVGGIRSDSFVVEPVKIPTVGWMQNHHHNATRDESRIAETAVNFDMTQIDAIDGKLTRAVLRFDEKKERWTSGSGAEQYKDGCVANLGIATVDWANQSVNALTPNDPYTSAPDGSSRAWEVTRHVREQLASPGKASLRYGYVLQGNMSLNNLEGDDSTSCYSTISNIHLDVTMDVEEQPAPAPPPPPPPPMPDLAVTRVSGPKQLAIGETVEYEIAIFNDGIAVQNQALLQINRAGPIQLMEVTEASNNGITCQANLLGWGCTGSLGGDDGPMAARSALFKVQVMGMGAGTATLIGSANHGRTFEEKTVDNNLQLLDGIAVQ